MSQSNDSPAPCADKEGHGKSTTSVCDTLRSEARGQKKKKLATVTIVAPPTGKRKTKVLIGVESDATVRSTH